jgi:maltose O-acetyltransferase
LRVADDTYEDTNRPICKQPGYRERIVIGDDCWIGSGAIIMRSIGTRCIIGAGAVVTSDAESHSFVAGNPARLVKELE